MRVGLVGANGLLGSYFLYAFMKKFEWDVYTISRSPVEKSSHHLGIESLIDVADLVQNYKFDLVVNCAAMASHEGCEREPEDAYFVNGDFPGILAQACASSGAYLVHISTDAVFDGEHDEPFSEKDEPLPQSVYGKSKLLGEIRALEAEETSLVLRTNFFSWSSDGKKGVLDFFVNAFQEARTVPGFTDYFTSSLYAADLVAALHDLVRDRQSGVFHVVSSSPMSKHEFGVSVAEVFDFPDSGIESATLAEQNFMAHRASDLSLSPAKLESFIGRKMLSTVEGLRLARAEMVDFWNFIGR